MTKRTLTHASAPASTAHLGPGFNTLAMAVHLRNEVQVRSGSGLVSIEGTGAEVLPADETNLVARAFASTAQTTIASAAVNLHCINRIPVGCGLGSSCAAAACGLIAGWEFIGAEWDEAQLLEGLAALDKPLSAAAACVYGGVVLCNGTSDPHDVIELGPVDWLRPIAVTPTRTLDHATVQAALPATFDAQQLARSIGAASLLVGGLLGGHPELVEAALEQDVAHEPYLAALIPELEEIRAAAATTNALGSTLSGTGPTVIVWCEPGDVVQVQGSLEIDFPDYEIQPLTCDPSGAHAGSGQHA